MRAYRFTLRPLTAFGSSLAGDTLFGQLCWTLRHACGEARLTELLQGYAEGAPFAVLSDAFPCGFLPLPCLPSSFWTHDDADRKTLKTKRWIAVEHMKKAPDQWMGNALNDEAAYGRTLDPSGGPYSPCTRAQPHNTINRLTGATGEGA
ncbi:MAG: CRISPR-associated protein Csm7, partial [Deltaproteobacteria bacterium]|nr:CRISPR-associated protein Csm7 [Deltaproteobacteria bacterium]